MTNSSDRWWDIAVQASSTAFALNEVWPTVSEATRDLGDVDTLASETIERGATIVAQATLRVIAKSTEDAIARVRDVVEQGLADDARLHDVHVETSFNVVDSADLSAIDDDAALSPSADSADFQPTVQPVAWGDYFPADDGRRLAIRWMSGRYELDRVEVHEDSEKVIVTVHERRPPAYNPDGSEGGMLLVGQTHRAEIELDAPLGERIVIDGYSGSTRQPADLPR